MKKIDNSADCRPTTSTCIEWQGSNITSLGISKGDCLDFVIYTIATKVEELASPLDLESVTLTCLIDQIGMDEPASKSIVNVLQLLVNTNCKLYQLIEALQNTINAGTDVLTLDLKCIAQYDSYGNLLPYDQQIALQWIINKVCSDSQAITDLQTRLQNLQVQVDSLNTDPYVEPSITTCLFSNKPTSQAVKLLGDNYCDYKAVIGSIASHQTAMGLLDPNFNSYYQTFPNWNIGTGDTGQLLQNVMIVLSNLFSRVGNIENNCCSADCEDIKVGFGVTVEGDNVTFVFNSLYGTKIPNTYEDCGSSFTITDQHGLVIAGYLSLENDLTTEPISIAGLTRGDMLTISINSKFCGGGVTCQSCNTKLVKYETECCTITNTGSQPIKIIYTVNTN